ncbi:MAG: CapA family protein [Christensenellales bacterium]|jgi:hypothetical protein
MKRDLIGTLALAAALCVAAAGLFFMTAQIPAAPPEPAAPAEPAVVEAPSQPAPQPAPPVTIRFMAAGDNLIHDNIYRQAAARTNGRGFDFSPAYQHVEGLFSGADLRFINQETIIAERLYALSGYPQFNSPEALGECVAQMGFNIVNVANNHMFDMGEKGLVAALDFWQSRPGILTIGAWRTEQAMQQPLLVEKDGVTIAFVPVTEHTNGLGLPIDTPMRYILSHEQALLRQQVELARASADFVVLSIHWGTENSLAVNNNQLELAQRFADWGVDLVLGHHSHTLQPMEWRTGGSENRTLVVYSLGNFISSMSNPQNMLGGVLDLDITKDPKTGKTAITRAQMLPVVTQYDGAARSEVRVYPLSQYTDALAGRHGLRADYGYFSLDYLNGIVAQCIPEEFRPDLAAQGG